MKFIKKMLIAVTFFAAITVQTDSFARQMRKQSQQPQVVVAPRVLAVDADTVVSAERQKLEQAIIDTEKIKTAATLAINEAKDKLAKNELSYVQAAQIIGEQNYKIEQVKEQLAQLTGQAIETVQDAQDQESYFSQLTTGVRSAGQGLLERVGYSSTAQEKAIAQAIIDELKNQLKMVDADYTEKMKAAMSPQDRMKLSQELNAIKQEINSEIAQQQTITEEVMSTNKKLFWTAVGLAGAAVGGALAYQYLGSAVPAAKVEDVLIETPLEPLQTTQRTTPGLLTFEEAKLMEQSKGPFDIMPEPTEVGTVLRTAEEAKLMQQPEGPFNIIPEPSAEEVYNRITEPTERELRPFNDETDEATQARRERIKAGVESGIEGAQELAQQYGNLSTQALKNAEDFNQQQTVPQEVIETVQEKLSQIPGETDEQYLARMAEAQKTRERSMTEQWTKQPFAKLPAEQQPTLSSIGQQISEGVQNAWEKTKESARALKEKVLSTPLVSSEDLESVELSPEATDTYRETVVSPVAETIGGVLVDAARVQQEQEEQQIPLNLGTGGQSANSVGGYARGAYDNASKYVKESAAKVFGEPAVTPEEPAIVKTSEQIEQGKRNQEAAQERLKAAQERKKQSQAKEPKGWQ